ncbi:hypothetical protein HOK51_09045 [Candidatus Woesearchaeota archaeon]|jgi:hypothetical protein|nr:hypothetical protein [Candidatus Woesearchaeota archaeon]MBT6519975.1 hypothetical protein [Candidatus Woesearchaeota archaeon]MBT7367824.1 hypothetical protein [Candidatus Woesearchaeota archaeon]
MFKCKPTKVIITGNAKDSFNKLNKSISEEISKGILNSDNQTILNSIKQKIEILKDNPEYGFHIPKDRIPKCYCNEYDVNNLWKVNLALAWRMIYTIRGSQVEIISLILDIFDHKKYNKKFGYKKK